MQFLVSDHVYVVQRLLVWLTIAVLQLRLLLFYGWPNSSAPFNLYIFTDVK